jgi:hypothetical protein
MEWIIGFGVPSLLGIGGIFTWYIKSKIEELQAIEKKLSEKRRELYIQILDPYIKLFSGVKSKNSEYSTQKVIKFITSYEYKKYAFELILFGSDEVVLAFNNMIKLASLTEEEQNNNPMLIIELFGTLLFEIRKSLGNKSTNLKEIIMYPINWTEK